MTASRSLFCDERVKHNASQIDLAELYEGVHRYSRFLTKNNWEADDLVQEALLKGIQSYHPSQLTPSLLNKIAYHHWIDTLRKRKHEVVGIEGDVIERQDTSRPGKLIDIVKFLINNLTPKQAVIFMLKEGFNFQAKEIAGLLSTTEAAVKSLLHRSKSRLEKQSLLQSTDSFWSEEEKELLSDLLYESLESQDPGKLIDSISRIPLLAEVPKLAKPNHSGSPLSLYCMAA